MEKRPPFGDDHSSERRGLLIEHMPSFTNDTEGVCLKTSPQHNLGGRGLRDRRGRAGRPGGVSRGDLHAKESELLRGGRTPIIGAA